VVINTYIAQQVHYIAIKEYILQAMEVAAGLVCAINCIFIAISSKKDG